MGDRANVAVVADEKRVYFYTHWSGYDLPSTVQAALAKRWRWDDGSYLARIIFCQMVGGDTDGETGYGISAEPGDNGYPILVVDTDKQQVTVEADTRESFARCRPKGEPRVFTFDEFVSLSEASWGALDPAGKED